MITDELGNPKKYFKKFTSSVLSLEEKYKQALNHLNIIKSQKDKSALNSELEKSVTR